MARPEDARGFPAGFVDDVRHAIGIRVIEEHVPLKRVGRTLKGLCPFHDEKTPSFHVDEAKGFYHCFGCGAGGDVFKFVMQQEMLTFPEAVKNLATKAGLQLPERRETSAADALRERVLAVNAAAHEAFVAELLAGRKDSGAADALDYLTRRGIGREVIDGFGIGWAPDSWDFLSAKLASRFEERELTASGLSVPRESRGGVYDRFRKRVTFPIRAVSDRIVGFGGRIVGEGEPKYLNSPETPVYTKGRHLYGLDRARAAIRRQGRAVLVEGYVDAIALHAAGIETAVAVLGTAVTTEQARLLARFTKKVVTCFDGDEAGLRATRKCIPVLLAEGFDVRVLRLPAQTDPDDHVRAIGGEAFARAVEQAGDFLEFVIGGLRREHDFGTPSGRAAALNEITPLLASVKDDLLRSELLDETSKALGMSRPTVKSELRSAIAGRRPVLAKAFEEEAAELSHVESQLLTWLIRDAQVRVAFRELASATPLDSLPRAAIYRAILDEPDDGFSLANVMERLPSPWERTLLSRHAVSAHHQAPQLDRLQEWLCDFLEQMGFSLKEQLRTRADSLERRVEQALAQNDTQQFRQLVKDLDQVRKAIHS
jgi:DNA primase